VKKEEIVKQNGSNEETFEIKFLYLQNNKMAYISS